MSAKRQLVYVILLAGLRMFGLVPVALAQNPLADANVTVQINRESAALMAGDWVEFNTVLHNGGTTATPPLVVHLNIAAVKKGRHVDPEDWSPERTQYLAPIQPGDSVQLTWKLHALFEGEFATFVTIVSPEKSFLPVASSSSLVHVDPDNILPMAEVIPVVVVVPTVPLALLLFSIAHARRRRRGTP
jgi:hypothetical protein